MDVSLIVAISWKKALLLKVWANDYESMPLQPAKPFFVSYFLINCNENLYQYQFGPLAKPYTCLVPFKRQQ